jgi:Fur family ferric uptake transcriptional regulator
MLERKELASLLRNRNLKATATRMDVLSVISNFDKAVSHTEIQNRLKDFDRVTLYRTLGALVENGIIHKAMADELETYYALCNNNCTSHHHNHKHIHFKCLQCNAVSCVSLADSISISLPGYIIERIEIEASGICKSCA